MTLAFQEHVVRSFPRLGWVARLNRRARTVSVAHGVNVETGPDFVVEGVWDGPFGANFHQAEHVFGSGVRVDDEAVHFVASCALVDRLLWAEDGDELIVSNSQALLLGRTGARLIADRSYLPEVYAPLRGILAYEDRIPVCSVRFEHIRQLYYRNMVWSPAGLRRTVKGGSRHFGGFEEYVSAMTTALDRLEQNAHSAGRHWPITIVGTLSRGYDSPCVCTLTRGMIEMCYTRRRSNSAIPPWLSRSATIDDGSPIAHLLGLSVRRLDGPVYDELWFLAGGDEPELAFSRLVRDAASRPGVTAMLSAFHGASWRTDFPAHDDASQPVRTDMSGLSLSEVRLRTGLLHVPVPFIHARSASSIRAISLSSEMHPFRVGGAYDKPIPRRILEESGVPRKLFGTRKKAIVSIPNLPMSRGLRRQFLRHIHRIVGIHPLRAIVRERLHRWSFPLRALPRKIAGRPTPRSLPPSIRLLPALLYTWAVNTLADRYAQLPQPKPTARSPD